MVSKIDRRDFIISGSAAICGAGLAADPRLGHAQGAGPKSKVIEVWNKDVITNNRKINEAAVEKMVSQGMKALTKSENPWANFVGPNDVVGLKINTLGRPLIVTHHELVRAVAKQLKAAGVKENNIIVWDRFESHMKDGKYKMNASSSGVRYIATETDSDSKGLYDPSKVYKSESDRKERRDSHWGADSPISKIFLKDCTKIINMAVLKDHALAGATLCLKNIAYGITCNNSRFHGRSHIDAFIADVCAMKSVKDKVVLHMVDGIEGCFDNGPLPRDLGSIFAPKKLWLGTDPVALDSVALAVIEAKRKEKGLAPLQVIGRPAAHITASAAKGLGNADPAKIKVKKISV